MQQLMSAGDPHKPFLFTPRDTIHPNKLAGDYIISLLLGFYRMELRVMDYTRFTVTKIFQRGKYYYICPQIGHAPPEGFRWMHMGRKHNRDVYRAL